MNNLNFLKPNRENLNLFLVFGTLFFVLGILDFCLNTLNREGFNDKTNVMELSIMVGFSITFF